MDPRLHDCVRTCYTHTLFFFFALLLLGANPKIPLFYPLPIFQTDDTANRPPPGIVILAEKSETSLAKDGTTRLGRRSNDAQSRTCPRRHVGQIQGHGERLCGLDDPR